MAGVVFEVKNFDKFKKEHGEKAARKKLEEAKRRFISDMKKRAPSWVNSEITKVYGVKKSELRGNSLGKVKIEGDDISNVAIIYSGRVLTPTHFSMNPKTLGAPNGMAAYTLKATFLKGSRVTLGKVKKLTKKQRKEIGKNFSRTGSKRSNKSPIMLMHTGNAQVGGTNYIPFQRVSENRKDIRAIKTVSLPQMVSSERTKYAIQTKVDEGALERWEHHLKQAGF